MKDKFDEHACAFKNEADCEEELEDDGLSLDAVESLHFDDEE